MRRKIAIFDVLGVRPEDDISKIRLAWHKKVKQLHPDLAKNAEDKDASVQVLAQVNAAFDRLKTHKPFAERRRGDRRKTWRSGRVWSHAERSRKLSAANQSRVAEEARKAEEEARRRIEAAEKARRRAQLEALARKNAEALERREAAARSAARARRAAAQPSISKEEQAMRLAAASGYQTARIATLG